METLSLGPDEGKPREHVCETCGKPLHTGKKYCSLQCCGVARRISDEAGLRTCLQCGTQFCVNLSHRDARFCSLRCSSRYHSGTGVIPCEVCGKPFRRMERGQRYCSKACYGASKRKPGNPLLVREANCRTCGKALSVGEYRYCSVECSAEGRRYKPEERLKQCEVCGKTFEISAYHWRTRYCSRECTTQALTCLPVLSKTCAVCATPFTTKKVRRRFCSPVCVNQWKRLRWEAMSPEERAEQAELIHARMEQVSTQERVLANVLDEWRVPYIAQHRVLHYYVDLYIPRKNLIIEAYGCYWHSCPRCGIGSGDNRESDEQRLAAITGHGYRVAILWEHDIRHDPYEALNNAFRQGCDTA
jgi:G:T-mismatch repair DNA endonuclease (very short patch repair protein)/predicted nucleic acid-binding Zn ribbon protein